MSLSYNEMRERFAHRIEHTKLGPLVTPRDIQQVCFEALEHGFGAVCVPFPFVRTAVAHLKGRGIDVGTVIGYPHCNVTSKILAEMGRAAVDEGASRVDAVGPLWTILDRGMGEEVVNRQIFDDFVMPLREALPGLKHLRMILEMGALSVVEQERAVSWCHECKFVPKGATGFYVEKASQGIQFIPGETFFVKKNTTVDHIQLMKRVAPLCQPKASGGQSKPEHITALDEAGAWWFGTSQGPACLGIEVS